MKIAFLMLMIVTICIAIMYEKIISRMSRDSKELWEKLIYERKKLFIYKKQVEVLNIFKKEIELISKENHYNSCVNLNNKIKSAVADANKLLH